MVLLIYDVVSDRVRSKISDVCLDYGLSRVQQSAFVGHLNANRQAEIMQKIARVAGRSRVDVRLFSICERDERLVRVYAAGGSDRDAG